MKRMDFSARLVDRFIKTNTHKPFGLSREPVERSKANIGGPLAVRPFARLTAHRER
jgi:hypothetical protein